MFHAMEPEGRMDSTGPLGVAHIPLSPILVVGLARPLDGGEPWVWRLLDHVGPRLRELAEATGTFTPEFRKADPRRFRLSLAAHDRRRMVLISEAMTGGEPEALRRWHCARPDAGIGAVRVGPELLTRPMRMQIARRINPARGPEPIPLLPYWLDDDIPVEGLDIIRVPGPPADFDRTLAGLMRLLWEVVREVGRPRVQARRSAA
jgi:hypothetical protein